jgi:prevent-host-death family protein
MDYGTNEEMKEIAISKFKATCLAVLEEVRRTGRPVRVTRFGKPVAEVVPPKAERKRSLLGCMEGTGEIVGDIVGPIGAFDNWGGRRIKMLK